MVFMMYYTYTNAKGGDNVKAKLLIPVKQVQLNHKKALTRRTYDLCRFIEDGGEVPPIHVCRLPDGNYGICDGRHRTLAYKLLDMKLIYAYCSEGINSKWRK